MPQNRILLGVIGRAHGVRGLVRVTSHTADPANLTAYGPLSDDKGRRFTLRWRGEGLAEVAELVNGQPVKIADRTAAEKLVNTRLYIDRTQLPEPAEEEFYLADLIGMTATDSEGRTLGRVATVHDYGAGASLEIVHDGAPSLLVPFTRACVPQVDLQGEKVILNLPTPTNLAHEVGEVEAQSAEGEGDRVGTKPAPYRPDHPPPQRSRGPTPPARSAEEVSPS